MISRKLRDFVSAATSIQRYDVLRDGSYARRAPRFYSGSAASGAEGFSEVVYMHFATVMMISWAVLAVITGALVAYRAWLQGSEIDQVALDDTFAREAAENEALAAKVNKIQPAINVMSWVLAAATVIVVCYWAWDFIVQFK
jgi:hypothetical protein